MSLCQFLWLVISWHYPEGRWTEMALSRLCVWWILGVAITDQTTLMPILVTNTNIMNKFSRVCLRKDWNNLCLSLVCGLLITIRALKLDCICCGWGNEVDCASVINIGLDSVNECLTNTLGTHFVVKVIVDILFLNLRIHMFGLLENVLSINVKNCL